MNGPDKAALAEQLMGTALIFGLLGKILYAFPEKALFQTLLSEDVFDEMPLDIETEDAQAATKLLNGWSKEQGMVLTDAALEALLVDYSRLFVGVQKVPAPLWESVYFNRERMVFQKETMQVRKWHQKYGLQIDRLHHEPDDHLGVELTFLAHLSHLALEALQQGDDERLAALLRDQQAFIVEHPLRWAADWCTLVQKYSRTDFFRGVALLVSATLSFVNAALFETLSQLPPLQDLGHE